MNEETIRADFEKFMSDDGKFPRAIERCGAGNYILSQSASSWRVWRNAYHQCLQSPEIQALRGIAKEYDELVRHMCAGGDFHEFQRDRAAMEQQT